MKHFDHKCNTIFRMHSTGNMAYTSMLHSERVTAIVHRTKRSPWVPVYSSSYEDQDYSHHFAHPNEYRHHHHHQMHPNGIAPANTPPISFNSPPSGFLG